MQPRLAADDDHFVAALSIFDQARATLLACALRPGSHLLALSLVDLDQTNFNHAR
jgi:hypothetical protein